MEGTSNPIMEGTSCSLPLVPANPATFTSSLSTTLPSNVKYEILRPHQLPLVHQLLYQSFHRDEPMTRHLLLHRGSFSIPDSDKMAEDLVIQHNLSIIALDPNNNNAPVGVILNGEFHKEELEDTRAEVMDGCIDAKFAPIAAILHEAQQRGRKSFESLDTDVVFDLKMMATAPEWREVGLCTNLLRRSILLAKCLGYKGIKSEVTGSFSRKASLRCGMEIVAEVKYNEFELDGEKVFEGIEGHDGVAYVMARLE